MTMTIEWHDAKKELPEKSGKYLVNYIGGETMTVNYSAVHKKFNAYDYDKAEQAEFFEIKVKWWAELPHFPDHSDVVNEVLNNG